MLISALQIIFIHKKQENILRKALIPLKGGLNKVPLCGVLSAINFNRLRQAHTRASSQSGTYYLFLVHKRIPKMSRRYKRFFDCPGGNPAHQVRLRTGFIIGTRGPATTKRLLADNRTGRFVVDIKITRCMLKSCYGYADSQPIPDRRSLR